MNYKINAIARIDTADETTLKNVLEAINTFVASKNGTVDFQISTSI